ncbi:MAG: DUF4430 domain-containing protein [Firmicutes bacterium]|nr:DUF4430 domain-containing protein [Bacillota bacterium]
MIGFTNKPMRFAALCIMFALLFSLASCSKKSSVDEVSLIGDVTGILYNTDLAETESINGSDSNGQETTGSVGTAEETTGASDNANVTSDEVTAEESTEAEMTSAESLAETTEAETTTLAENNETTETEGETTGNTQSDMISVTVSVRISDKYAEYLIYTINAERQAALDASSETTSADDDGEESGDAESDGENETAEKTETETIELFDIPASERVILSSVTVTVEVGGDGEVSVLDAVTAALSEYGVDYTLDLTGQSISTIAGYEGGTLSYEDSSAVFFWGYSINGVEPSSGRAGTNFVSDGDVILYSLIATSDAVE